MEHGRYQRTQAICPALTQDWLKEKKLPSSSGRILGPAIYIQISVLFPDEPLSGYFF